MLCPKQEQTMEFSHIRYQGANYKIWNDISDNFKLLSLKQFKKKLKLIIIASYVTEYCTVHFLSSVSQSACIFYFIFLLIFAKLYFKFKTSLSVCFCVVVLATLKKYMTPLKFTVYKTLRMAAQFY